MYWTLNVVKLPSYAHPEFQKQAAPLHESTAPFLPHSVNSLKKCEPVDVVPRFQPISTHVYGAKLTTAFAVPCAASGAFVVQPLPINWS